MARNAVDPAIISNAEPVVVANNPIECVYCDAVGDHLAETCTHPHTRTYYQMVHRSVKCNICMQNGHRNKMCKHSLIQEMKSRCEEIVTFHNITMIRGFIRSLPLNQLRAICRAYQIRMDLSRTQLVSIVCYILTLQSKQQLTQKILKIIEKTMHENDRSVQTDEVKKVKHNLVVKLVQTANKARTMDEKYARVMSKYADVNLDEAGYCIDVYVMHRSDSRAKHAFWMQPPPESRECNICFETIPPEKQVMTSCKHAFCKCCMFSYLESFKDKDAIHPPCPVCRTRTLAIFE
jgi:hypothetical protein